MKIESGIIVFTVNLSRWTANKKLKAKHIKAKEEELPPADLASLGVRKVFDPKALAPFEAIRKETERLCFNEGTRFFGGVAVPKKDADSFLEKLKKLQERFNNEKELLAQSYKEVCSKWAADHPGWENVVLEDAPELEWVLNRFKFDINAIEIVMADKTDESGKTELDQKIESSQMAFIDQLYAEIAQMANLYQRSLLGKERATVRSLSALQTMRKKLNGMGFLDNRIRPLVEMIDKVISEMPATGNINGVQFATLLGITNILSNKDMMKEYGEKVSEGEDANSLFRYLTATKVEPEKPTVAAAPEVPTKPVIKPGIPQFTRPQIPNFDNITPPMAGGWGKIPSRIAVAT